MEGVKAHLQRSRLSKLRLLEGHDLELGCMSRSSWRKEGEVAQSVESAVSTVNADFFRPTACCLYARGLLLTPVDYESLKSWKDGS